MTRGRIADRLSFTVYGEAAPAGSKTRATSPDGSRTWTRDSSKRSYPWKKDVKQVAGEAMGGASLFDGPIRLTLVFYRPRPKGHFGSGRNAGRLKDSAPDFPTTKPDALKLARAIEDALTGVVYRDDALIVEGIQRKLYGEPARVDVTVTALSPADAILLDA